MEGLIALLIIAACTVGSYAIGYKTGKIDADDEAYKDGMRDIISIIPDEGWREAALEVVNIEP